MSSIVINHHLCYNNYHTSHLTSSCRLLSFVLLFLLLVPYFCCLSFVGHFRVVLISVRLATDAKIFFFSLVTCAATPQCDSRIFFLSFFSRITFQLRFALFPTFFTQQQNQSCCSFEVLCGKFFRISNPFH